MMGLRKMRCWDEISMSTDIRQCHRAAAMHVLLLWWKGE